MGRHIGTRRRVTRRRLLEFGTATAAGLTLAGTTHLRRVTVGAQSTPETSEAVAIVGDVLDFTLGAEGRWAGHFGSVTLRLHPGFFNGGDAWFIRTDASDPEFAGENGLVFVPLLKQALQAADSYAEIYLFEGGDPNQRPVVGNVPGETTYTPAFRVNRVTFSGAPTLLDSEQAVNDAVTAGSASREQTEIVVNYPLVIWPDGGLAVDPDLTAPLAPGPLISEPDLAAGTVTFKLHQCYPGSRYIATDTSAAPMGPMMGIPASEATQALIEAKATAPIYVFGNGIPGPAAMGFQPSIFNSKAGETIWSPFWEHMTVIWADGVEPVVLTTEQEVIDRATAGDLTVYKGVPESDPVSFVVNCPAPVLAANDFDPATFVPAATPTA
jgi:hypothetical protein